MSDQDSPNVPVVVPPEGTALTAADSTKVVFGLVFEINGTEVPITTADLADAAKKGFEFTLPEPLSLGSIDDLRAWLKENFKVDLPDPATFPPPLDGVVTTVTSAVFTIDALHVKVPPKSAAGDGQEAADAADGPADGKTRFTLRISATVPEPPNLIPGLDALKIKGAVFGVTNEPAQQTA